ncbi:MAG: thioredoxin domain-containing protein [Patescibacteria group bacterium]
MSQDSKFALGVVIAAAVAIGALVFFGRDKPVDTANIDTEIGQKIGAVSAKVKIVEFGDFQCPACQAAAAPLRGALEQNGDDVQLIYRHFPLPSHQHAMISALAAEAAGAQGKFWEMYDLLFANQDTWSKSDKPKEIFISLAKQLNLDAGEFEKQLSSAEAEDLINKDKDYGLALGVNSTPTFFVNNQKVTGAQTVEQWQKLTDEAKKN